ncbi:hypothetical protein CXF71_07980 [Colwellia sp. 12G3]|nr:hypothetical protein CXF71_07980 [Colwellia sp. 12G3]
MPLLSIFPLSHTRAIPHKIFNRYTRYQSKCGNSVGNKIALGKEDNLSIVILCFDYLTPHKAILNP